MHRFLIKCINCGWLVIVLIGIPAITKARFGHLEVSSPPTAHILILWGLSFAVVGNTVTALSFGKARKEYLLCWEWVVVFSSFLGIEYALFHDHLNFNWLKQALSWLQKHL